MNLSEVFGYSPTAGIILLAALLLDPSLTRPRRVGDEAFAARADRGKGSRTNLLPGLPGGRWSPPALLQTEAVRMAAVTFSGGLTTDIIKLLVTRVRPYAADLALHSSVIDTFSNVEGVRGVAMQSFPSGHAAVAAGLTSALCWRYPRGSPLFIAVGIAAAAQRLTSGSHYGSDVAVGAAIALACAAFWLRGDDSTKSA